MRWSAWGFVILGFFAGSLYQSQHEAPQVQIGNITPLKNFSSLRVHGWLEADARQLHSGSVLYIINDGTGVLPIFLAQPPEGNLPRAGQHLSAIGRLNVGTRNELRLRVQHATDLALTPEKFIADFRISEVGVKHEGTYLTVWGRVSKVWHPPVRSKAPHRIILVDPSGSLEVISWFHPGENIKVGRLLKIEGILARYRGRLQLKIKHRKDITLVTF